MLNKVKVGGIVYDVEFKELEAESGVQLGWCNYSKSKLEINNHNINLQKQEQTLIHEMTHAIMHEAGVGFGDDEERVVNHISLILHQVLKDNDFSWLREDDKWATRTVITGVGSQKYIFNENNELVEVD